jgi:membrane fusion protein (multidrug efflux system)
MRYPLILLTLISLAIVISSCKHQAPREEEYIKFLVSKPLVRDTIVFHDYVCQIRSIRHIELRALEKGYLQNIFVDEGQMVQKGQILFQIMPIVYQAEAQKAYAELQFAEIEYQNTKSLADSNVVSKNELALAKAKLEKAKADYELAKAHLGFTEVKAPFDGIIGRFNEVRVGSLVDEGELLTTLSDNSKMWVYYNVPESEYLDYIKHHNDKKSIRVKLQMANNQMFDEEGYIETIEADFNNETGNIAFRATFNNPEKILRHGETGNILMPVNLNNALLIPQKATFEVLDKKYVYVVDASGVVQAREITVQYEIPHIYAVSSGIKEDENILVEGLRKVKNGDKIHSESVSFYEVLNEMRHLKAE